MTLDGKMARCGENFCAMCVSLAKKSSEGKFFVPAGTHLGVKLLITLIVGSHFVALVL